MAARERTFFLAPESHWVSGKIKLGGILRHPKQPDDMVDGRIPIPEASTHTTTKRDFVEVITDLKKHSLNVFAQFLQLFIGVGVNVGVFYGKAELLHVEAERVTTEYFEPPLDYLQQSLQIPMVQILCRRNTRKPLNLFMITAVMVVEGLNVKTVSSEGYGIDGSTGIDGTMIGLPVGGGSGIGTEHGSIRRTSAEAPGPLVFAYQVREIKRKKRKDGSMHVKAAGYTKGAQLDYEAGPGAGPRIRALTDEFELIEYNYSDECDAEGIRKDS
ncbi:hypothetical protein TWF696_003398 [Orbilia brochopaga]|uniref:Uncharacterized protein n=1 Tax=Orbilia brochopaga TaxID=3140254 RepID=A0AAV9TZS9_9PEZI